jgi:glutamine amidotransferase
LKIGIIDLGINNLSSVSRAFSLAKDSSDEIKIVSTQENENFDLLVLPGLGKFGAGMKALNSQGLTQWITNSAKCETRIVGICLGMQLLASSSDESPSVEGLGLVAGHVTRLIPNEESKVPHMGWNEVFSSRENDFMDKLNAGGDYYFVHSYHLAPIDSEVVIGETQFGKQNFTSAVLSENILGFQFHPEKSGNRGQALISEVIKWARNEN